MANGQPADTFYDYSDKSGTRPVFMAGEGKAGWSPKMPYDVWLNSLTPEALKQYVSYKAHKRMTRRKRTYKRKSSYGGGGGGYRRSYRRSYRNKRRRGRYFSGKGAYYLDGSIAASIPGFGSASLRGGVASGLGDYTITSNSLVPNISWGQGVPEVRNSNKGEATTFRHKEYLMDLYSGIVPSGSNTTEFTLQSFAINPGNPQLFPWLAPLAYQFQEWKPQGIIIELKTLCSDYTQQLAMGAMFMATQYNSLEPEPTTKQQMENLEYSNSCKPSCSLLHMIECDIKNTAQTHLYIADNGNYEGGDLRWYDLGNLFIGTQGLPTALAPIAEVWITYEIDLYKPVLGSATAPVINVENYTIQCSLQGTSITSANNFGTNSTITPINYLPFLNSNSQGVFDYLQGAGFYPENINSIASCSSSVTPTIYLPNILGSYWMVTVYWSNNVSTAGVTCTPPFSGNYINCQPLSNWQDGILTVARTPSGTGTVSSNTVSFTAVYLITQANPTSNYASLSWSTAPVLPYPGNANTFVDIIITSVNGNNL